jgi:hypothetical protein
MGGMVWEIMSASNLPSIGFFYPFFTPFLMRSPCPETGGNLTKTYNYVILNINPYKDFKDHKERK